jgi:hypothetical protein
MGADESAPHYVGHRDRLKSRFAESGGDGFADYELLELVLFRSIPRRDVKPIAKALIGSSDPSPKSWRPPSAGSSRWTASARASPRT